MDNLSLEDLKTLAQHEETPKVSMFVPTFRAGPDVQQNRTRYKNLLGEAEQQLAERGLDSREVASLLGPARALLDDETFWRHPTECLVVFAAPGTFNAYRLPLPDVDERLIIGQHYTFTPVLPMFTHNGQFYILALSQNEIRLFGATRYNIWPVALPDGMPADIEEALQHETVERQLQMHSDVGRGVSGGIFHGSDTPDNKERIHRFLNIVDAALKPMLREQRTPLVLAAVEYMQPIYREESEYPHVLPEGIVGNPENLRPEELHERAWPLVEPVFRQRVEKLIGQYNDLSATDRAPHDLHDIVEMAAYGRVDTLFTDVDAVAWGTFDPDTGKVVVRRGDGPRSYEDLALVDFAAIQTLLNGGQVFALHRNEMPVDAPAAAVLRY